MEKNCGNSPDGNGLENLFNNIKTYNMWIKQIHTLDLYWDEIEDRFVFPDKTYEAFPFKESRKEYLTRKFGNLYDIFDYKGARKNDPYTIADRIIKANIGKDFNHAFSNFCYKVDKRYQSIFLNKLFDLYPYNRKFVYIDNNNKIQKIVKIKRLIYEL